MGLDSCMCPQALISLQEMYESAVRRGCPRPAAIEAEFRAYHMLMLLNEHGRLKSAKLQIVSSLQVSLLFLLRRCLTQYIYRCERPTHVCINCQS